MNDFVIVIVSDDTCTPAGVVKLTLIFIVSRNTPKERKDGFRGDELFVQSSPIRPYEGHWTLGPVNPGFLHSWFSLVKNHNSLLLYPLCNGHMDIATGF